MPGARQFLRVEGYHRRSWKQHLKHVLRLRTYIPGRDQEPEDVLSLDGKGRSRQEVLSWAEGKVQEAWDGLKRKRKDTRLLYDLVVSVPSWLGIEKDRVLDYAREVASRMGIREGVMVMHTDEAHPHVHVLHGRQDGPPWRERKEIYRLHKTAEEVASELGLPLEQGEGPGRRRVPFQRWMASTQQERQGEIQELEKRRDESLEAILGYPIELYLTEFYGLRAKDRDGRRRIYCLSPFRDEKRPSFVIYPETNTWFDFGLGRGGSVITFEEVMGRTKAEAIALLKKRILPRVKQDPSLVRKVDRSQEQDLRKPFTISKDRVLGWRGTQHVLRRHGFSDPAAFEELYREGRIICTQDGELICPMIRVDEKGRFSMCGVAIRYLSGAKKIEGERGVSLWKRKGNRRLAIFEGVRDALAFVARDDVDVLITHGAISKDQVRAIKHIVKGYEDVLICFDADPQGQRMASMLQEELKGVSVWILPPQKAKDWFEELELNPRPGPGPRM